MQSAQRVPKIMGWGREQRRDGQGAGHLPDRLPDCSGEVAAVGQEAESSATQAQLGQQCGQRMCPHL